MARFRQYKNGIFGHRYKGLYITRNNSNRWKNGKLYSIIDENGIRHVIQVPEKHLRKVRILKIANGLLTN